MDHQVQGRQRISVAVKKPFSLFSLGPALKAGRGCLKAGWPIVCLTLALALPVAAATYYVSPDGDNSADGSQAAPWKTIQKAAQTVQAGDTVLVQSGFYPEYIDWNYAAGTPENRITFQAQGAVTNYGWYFREHKAGITLQGFTVTGQTVTGNRGTFHLENGASHIELIGNTVAHHESLPLGVYYGVFTRSVTNIVIRGNQFLNFKRHAVVVNGRGFLIESNYFTAPYGYDAIMPNTSDTIIRRNIFYDVSNYGYLTNGLHCDLIQTFSLGDSGWATNVVVEENFAKNCYATQILMAEASAAYPDRVRDWTIRNNIWVNVSASGSIWCEEF